MLDSFLRSHLFFVTSFLPSCSDSLLAEILQLEKGRTERETDLSERVVSTRNAFQRMREKYIIKIKLQTRVHIIPKLITSRGPCAPLFVLSSHRAPYPPSPAFTNESKRLKVFWCATQSIVRFPMTMILIDSATKGIRLRLCDLSPDETANDGIN